MLSIGWCFGRATGTPDRPRQIELDSSMIAAQKPVGPNPRVPSSAQGKFEILDVEAQTREKTFTSSDALNLRNFANNRGVEDAPTARPLSSNPVVAPVSPDAQSLASAAPLTNSVGEQVAKITFLRAERVIPWFLVPQIMTVLVQSNTNQALILSVM